MNELSTETIRAIKEDASHYFDPDSDEDLRSGDEVTICELCDVLLAERERYERLENLMRRHLGDRQFDAVLDGEQ